jgi:hypothetical protein
MGNLRDMLFNNTQSIVSLNANSVLLTLTVASVCGLVIYLMYRFFNKSVVYSANFNILIFIVCVVTAFIIITIGANLVLSLGMVGALSIVRFRAAVKDPLDVGFLFWGVAAGLTAGAQLYLVALLGTAFIALLYSALSFARVEKRAFLLILRYAYKDEAQVDALLKATQYKLKNKTHNDEWVELVAEVKVKRNNADFIQPFLQSPAITTATLTEYAGEYT